MRRKRSIVLSGVMSLVLLINGLAGGQAEPGFAEAKIKLSSKKITISAGKTKKIAVKNVKKNKIKWNVKKKGIATIKKSGKYAVKVTGKKKGSTTVVCKVKKGKKWKKLNCKVIVKAASSKVPSGTVNNTANAAKSSPTSGAIVTPAPTSTAGQITSAPTGTPGGVKEEPSASPTVASTFTASPTVASTFTASPTVAPTFSAMPTVEPTPFVPYEFIKAGFENGTEGFAGRGAAVVSNTESGRTGKALSVTGRTNTWNGASIDVSSKAAKGAEYSFSAWVKHDEGAAKAIKLSAELKAGEDTSYPAIAEVSCESGTWTKIEGTYTVPDKFTSLNFYFEGPDGTYDFLVDDLVIIQQTKGKDVIDPLSLPSLKDAYSGIFERVGNVLSYNTSWNNGTQLQEDTTMKYAQKQFNSFTLENEMKPESILPNWGQTISVDEAKTLGYVIPGNYKDTVVPKLNFDTLDIVLQKAKQYNIQMRAHVLQWHQQTATRFFKKNYDDSQGVVSTEVMDARLEMYIRTVMKHVMEKEKQLTGRAGSLVYCWDVTNEYIHREKDPTSTTWQDVYGAMGLQPVYVKKAYEVAYNTLEQYNLQDTVTLFYNDYDEYNCADDIVALVNYINSGEKANICGGIGMQSHIDVDNPTVELYAETLDKFLATGLQVQVTELDIGMTEGKTAQDQADYYKAIMSTIRQKHENRDKKVNPRGVTGVTIWGLYDALSWRPGTSPVLFGDGLGDPKAAFYAVLEAAKN